MFHKFFTVSGTLLQGNICWQPLPGDDFPFKDKKITHMVSFKTSSSFNKVVVGLENGAVVYNDGTIWIKLLDAEESGSAVTQM